jgi:aminopeptidase N
LKKKAIVAFIVVLFLFAGYYIGSRIGLERQGKVAEEKAAKDSTSTSVKKEKNSTDSKDERTLYNLDLVLDANKKLMKGSEVVKFKNKYNSSLKEMVFHLYPDSYNSADTRPSIGTTLTELSEEEIGDIKISSLKVNGTETKYTEDKQILKFSLDKALKPGETVEIAIAFTLKIPRTMDRLGYENNQYSLTNWYPILSIYDEKSSTWDETPFHPVGESNYSDTSDYKVAVSVPKGMVVVTTGVKISQLEEKSRDKINFEALNNRDFVLFLSKDYKLLSKEVDGIMVNCYYLKEETTAKRMLELACESLKFFNDTFGKYPYPEYDVVETYLQGGAMEYPTVTQMGPYVQLSEDYRNDSLTFFDEAVVHETAHQWWYSTVGNNEFKEPILDESFTAHSTALFFESAFGEYHPGAVKAALLRAPIKTTRPIYRSTDKFTWNDFGAVVYGLGPVVLEDLRQKVGQDKFIDIFKTYYEKYKFKNATFEGFLQVVKEKCGKEASDYVNAAFTSEDYTMDKLVLSEAELKKIEAYEKKTK